MIYINNSLHLARKYTQIFVRGHYLFREANSFPRAKLEENCELRGTDNVQGQIFEHIFAAKLRLLCLLFVDFNGYRSSSCQIRCGVPQGSILGPLLFLIYINDICNVSKVLDFILFADDTNIFFSHKDELFLSQTLNSELLSLSEWCKVNKLSINLKKCNFMIFKPRQKRRTLDISVVLNNHIIAQTKEVVFLGVILDENLSWKPHILNVSRKISKSIGIIYKSSFCLSAMSLRTLYFSLVYPYLIYWITVWGSTYQTNLKRLITLQKKVIKIISNVPFDAHTDNLFRDHQILKFCQSKAIQVETIYTFKNYLFIVTSGFFSQNIKSRRFV